MKITHLIVAAALSLTAAACASEPEPDTRGVVHIWDIERSAASPIAHLRAEMPADAASFLADDDEIQYACGCDNQGCVDAWATKRYDCNVCVTLNCGNRVVGSCITCPLPEGELPDHYNDENSGTAIAQ